MRLNVWLLTSLFGSFFLLGCSFFIISIINHDYYVLGNLEVTEVLEINEFGHPQRCKIILIWNHKKIKIDEAVQKIETLSSLNQKWFLDLKNHHLVWKWPNKIEIPDFFNDCEWFFQPVMIKMEQTTLLDYFFFA